jgi:hypothetical protein
MWQRAPHVRAWPHNLSSPLLFPYSAAGCLLSSSSTTPPPPRLLPELRLLPPAAYLFPWVTPHLPWIGPSPAAISPQAPPPRTPTTRCTGDLAVAPASSCPVTPPASSCPATATGIRRIGSAAGGWGSAAPPTPAPANAQLRRPPHPATAGGARARGWCRAKARPWLA